MKKLFTLILILTCTRLFAQDTLKSFNYSRNHITKTGMEVLGGWGLANIGVGAVGWANSQGGQNKYFYQMTTIWGAANLGISFLGFTGSERDLKKQMTVGENLKAQQNIEKTFLINGGLDFVYIGAGIVLKNRGDNRDDAQLKGYGPSIIMQGAFLLLFDATMYHAQRTNGNKLRRFLEKNPVTFTGNKIGIIYTM
jgi:hypothetical protein